MCVSIGLLAGAFAYATAVSNSYPRDLGQVWYAARVLWAGGNPYDLIGPGSVFEWPWPLYYPLPAAVAVTPLTVLSQPMAAGVFMAIGGALFSWALTEHGYWPLVAWSSACTLFAVQNAQWSPLLASALVLPPVGLIFAAKPNIGLALFAARPSWWPIAGGLILCAIAFAVQPRWPWDWIASLRSTNVAPAMAFHSKGPITLPGGFLVLFGLLRWRRPEARLLVALACVPQTMTFYEAVPLFLIPRTRNEAIVLTLLSGVIYAVADHMVFPDKVATYEAKGRLMLYAMYLPCLAMVLRRPNEGHA